MTIAAGFVCRDGIVICADTQLTLSTQKASRTKLFMSAKHEKSCRIAVAAAGDYDLCKATIQFTEPALNGDKPPSMNNVQSAFEDAISDVYTNHIYPNRLESKHVQLLVGIWTKDAGLRLLKTYDTAVLNVTRFEAIGSGSETAEHIFGKLYEEDMSVDHGVALAIYMLSEVKRSDQHSGGATHILVLHADGRLSSVLLEQVEEYEQVLGVLDKMWKMFFWSCFDLNRPDGRFKKDVRSIMKLTDVMRGPIVKQAVEDRLKAAKVAAKSPRALPKPKRPSARSVRRFPKRDR